MPLCGQVAATHYGAGREQTMDDDRTRIMHVEDLAELLGCSSSALLARLSRGAVSKGLLPRPVRLGRRLGWWPETVSAWRAEQVACVPSPQATRLRGRPRK